MRDRRSETHCSRTNSKKTIVLAKMKAHSEKLLAGPVRYNTEAEGMYNLIAWANHCTMKIYKCMTVY